MTVTDQLKIIDNKIKANQAQYDLDRLAAKISAYSSGDLGEHLEYKPSVLEQARFEYSPLGKFFNKGLDKDDQKEGVLRGVKNIRNKNERQLKAIENQRKKQLNSIKKDNQLKDDGTKSMVLLKDGQKDLSNPYRDSFSTFVKSDLKQFATSQENIYCKKLFKEIFFDGFSFLKRYSKSYMLLKSSDK